LQGGPILHVSCLQLPGKHSLALSLAAVPDDQRIVGYVLYHCLLLLPLLFQLSCIVVRFFILQSLEQSSVFNFNVLQLLFSKV
jgi:hypothetical protein